jgi:hypothetical protein
MVSVSAGCETHGVADERGVHAEVLDVPPCNYVNATYGGWSQDTGGFVFVAGCALEVANKVAEQLDEEPDESWWILRICPDHEGEEAEHCPRCAAEIAAIEADAAAALAEHTGAGSLRRPAQPAEPNTPSTMRSTP